MTDTTPSPSPRIRGLNPDGTPYTVAMTVGQLRKELERYKDDAEVLMQVRRKRRDYPTGKLQTVEFGWSGQKGESQIWLNGAVIDESEE